MLVHSEMNSKKRLDEFETDDSWEAVVQVNILGEGWDHPLCSFAVVLKPIRSSGTAPVIFFRTRGLVTLKYRPSSSVFRTMLEKDPSRVSFGRGCEG